MIPHLEVLDAYKDHYLPNTVRTNTTFIYCDNLGFGDY